MDFTPPPPAPSTADKPTFSSRADALVAWLSTFVTEAGLMVSDLNALVSGLIAQMNAVLADIDTATSVTNLTLSPGLKTIQTQQGLSYRAGMFVMVARTAAPTAFWMFGQVESYSPTTGILAVTVPDAAAVHGTGSFTDWTISLSGPRGQDGNVTAGRAAALALIFGG